MHTSASTTPHAAAPALSEAARAVVEALKVDQRSQVFALADDGSIAEVPPSLGAPADRCVVPPAHHATIAHLVDPLDIGRVLTLWDTVLADGVATGVVRLPGSTEQYVLAFADARAEHGYRLASLTPLGVDPGDGKASLGLARSAQELRPRTATLRKSTHALITEVPPRAQALFGFDAAEMLGRRSTEFLHPEDIPVALDGWLAMLSTGAGYRARVRHRRVDGSWLWIDVVHEPVHAADGTLEVHADITDISAEMAAVEELRRRERLFRRTVEALPVGLLRMDVTGHVVQVNARFGALLGGPGELPADAGLRARLCGCRPEDAEEVLAVVAACLEGGGEGRVQVSVGGDEWSGGQHCSVDVTPLGDDDGESGVVLVVQDVTEAVRAQRRLTQRATTDGLTGCLNRAAVLAELEDDLFAPRAHSPGVVFLDLDGFKAVNDRLGHAVGDALLVRVAEIVRATVLDVASGAQVSRLGGDEFLVVVHDSADEHAVQALADTVCEALRTQLPQTPELAGCGYALPVGASAGASRAVDGDTAGSLVARADAAMYVAKRAGRRAEWSSPAR